MRTMTRRSGSSVCDVRARPCAILLSASAATVGLRLPNMERVSTEMDDSRRGLQTVPRSGRRRVANVERLPAALHDPGRCL
jgi:hypothetical protein